MKILAISGGTRNGTNDSMAKEALMGAREMGAEIEFIHLLDLDLKPCTGCNACTMALINGEDAKCVLKDDFAWIEDKILDADGVIFVNPIFEKGVPGIMDMLQDRLCGPKNDYGMNVVAKQTSEEFGGDGPDPRKLKKKVVSFICMGGSDWTQRASCDVNTMAMSTMWTVIDDVVFQWSATILMDDERVAKCHQVGVNIANAAKNMDNAKYMGTPGICPNCNSRGFYFDVSGKVVCEVCGVKGDMMCEDGTYKFVAPEEEYIYAHNTLKGKIKHNDDIGENLGTRFEAMKSPEYTARVAKYKAFIEPTKPPRA